MKYLLIVAVALMLGGCDDPEKELVIKLMKQCPGTVVVSHTTSRSWVMSAVTVTCSTTKEERDKANGSRN